MDTAAPSALTTEEWRLVQNPEWLLAKNRVMQKVYDLFGALHRQLETLPALQSFPFPQPCLHLGAKISKGENYQGLPYAILDYPRLFTRESIFAYRTMFWWGHNFTCTLHLSGQAYQYFLPALLENFPLLRKKGLWISRTTDPWIHELEAPHFEELSDIEAGTWKAILEKSAFMKLGRPQPLHQWENLIKEGCDTLNDLLEILS